MQALIEPKDQDPRPSSEAEAPRPDPREPLAQPTPVPVPEAHTIVPHKEDRSNIKLNYGVHLSIGLLVVLGVLIALFRAPLYPSEEGLDITLVQQEIVQMEEITQTEQEAKPPPPPRPPIPVEVPNDTILEDDELLDLDASLDIDEPIGDLPPPPPTPQQEEQQVVEEEPEIFIVVEQMPEIIGGPTKVYEVLEYPPLARQAGMEGLVVVQFIVEINGEPSNFTVARSAGAILDQAAMEAVRQLRFTPGKQRNVPVRVQMALPIRFRLKDASRNS